MKPFWSAEDVSAYNDDACLQYLGQTSKQGHQEQPFGIDPCQLSAVFPIRSLAMHSDLKCERAYWYNYFADLAGPFGNKDGLVWARHACSLPHTWHCSLLNRTVLLSEPRLAVKVGLPAMKLHKIRTSAWSLNRLRWLPWQTGHYLR